MKKIVAFTCTALAVLGLCIALGRFFEKQETPVLQAPLKTIPPLARENSSGRRARSATDPVRIAKLESLKKAAAEVV